VDNPNYYDLKLKNLNMEVEYSGVFIGNLVQNSTITFAKRAITVSNNNDVERRKSTNT
jgi:hypothetical protein